MDDQQRNALKGKGFDQLVDEIRKCIDRMAAADAEWSIQFNRTLSSISSGLALIEKHMPLPLNGAAAADDPGPP